MKIINPNTFHNLTAITSPTVSDDSTQSYEVDSRWLNTVTKEWYICRDNTAGAAQWDLFVINSDLPTNSVDKANEFTYREHFVGALGGSFLPVTNSSTSGGSVSSIIAAYKRPGGRRLTTGSVTAASRCQDTVSAGVSSVWFNDGITQIDFRVKPPIAGTVTDGYELLFGFTTAVGLPPSLGVYWYYNRQFYGDDFMRCIFIRGALKVEHTTSISMGVSSIWRDFGVRSNAGTALTGTNSRNFEFYYGDDSNTYALIDTITEAQISAALITLPYQTSDAFNISYGIQKRATSLVARSLDIDSFVFYKNILG